MSNATSASMVRLTPQVLAEMAEALGVCRRPVMRRRTDTQTGDVVVVPIRCNSTEARKCPSCAQRNRWLRISQCHEGWHLDEEPEDPDTNNSGDDDPDDDPDDDSDSPDNDEGKSARRVRSTRRRQDVPDLPRLPVEKRTVGKTFTTKDGKTYRPSMFITLTLGSYGPVHPDGTPKDPATYDYRRAALDALHLPKLFDRFIQNLRRAVGYQVQYFAVVEPQRRLAPHLHIAIRGVVSHQLLKQVVQATYTQLWWPPHDQPVYTRTMPVWDEHAEAFVGSYTGQLLPTFEQAVDQAKHEDAPPAHVLMFGDRMDSKGVVAAQADAARRVRYLTKYLTKSIAEGIGDPDQMSPRQLRHLEKLHEEVRWLPCTDKCWNWLRYGIQPKGGAEAGMTPGYCPNKAHDRDHLGCGGRRVLVSTKWTRKTLADHRADRAAVVEEVLDSAGMSMPDQDRCSATATGDDGQSRYRWDPVLPGDPDAPTYRQAITALITERQRWRTQYEAARQQMAQARAGPDDGCSATEFGNSSARREAWD
jgi:Replication initiator protein, pSAM2